MGKRIAIIQGHPDPGGGHFGHALAEAYAHGAREGGHEVLTLEVAQMALPLLRSQSEWETGPAPAAVADAQRDIAWAQHAVIVFPLWLGDMPAVLKGFFEQVFRPGFAIGKGPRGMGKGLLKGRSVRIVVTMGMPAFFYRAYFGAHSVKNLKRNILAFCGFAPVRTTLVGTVEGRRSKREEWLATLASLGKAAR